MNEWISVKDKLPEKDNWKVYAVITCQKRFKKISNGLVSIFR